MLASSFFDPVLGLDVHFEMVPMPAPVPTPIPNPFTGIVFDPMGLAAGIALGAAIGAVMGAPFKGPVMYWTAFPATNTGTEAKHVPGHILIPPGVAWAPFPKTPKPVIHPGETPTPGLPIKPENDAIVVFGSKTVSVMGSNAVRIGDIALSCSEPLRLPSSVVLAVPKGAPILIGGPPSLDLMAAFMASLRTRFVSDSLHAALSRLKPSRFRNAMNRVVCFFTGHPVDVASGRVMTEARDLELPGLLPLKIERIYSSAFAGRDGPLGHGWSLSLDQSVYTERGQVVLHAEDGREIVFDTFDFPDHTIAPGQHLVHSIEGLSLVCEAEGSWRVIDRQGSTRHFAPIPGRSDGRAMLTQIQSRCGQHRIEFHYGAQGLLEWVRDPAGRLLHLVHDQAGRVIELQVSEADGEGFYCHRRYGYDKAGDLVEVEDSLGASWRYAYLTHLLTRETNRNQLSFYFGYDGLGEDAWCVRTWGDAGIYDHTITYDKLNHVTAVTNSLGHCTIYRMNTAGLVVEVVDPHAGKTCYEYDPHTFARTTTVDPSGATTRYGYDARGNRVHYVAPDGREAHYTFDEHGVGPLMAVDFAGHEWRWSYDSLGRLRTSRPPSGAEVHYEYTHGHLHRTIQADGTTTHFGHDHHGNLATITDAKGSVQSTEYDALGRVVARRLVSGASERYRYDTEGRVRSSEDDRGHSRRFSYDAEGNLLTITGARGLEQELRYGPLGRLIARTAAGATTQFFYDTELRLEAVENPLGERQEIGRDACGLIVFERGFDLSEKHFTRDVCGRVSVIRHASGRTSEFEYDLNGRLLEVRHSDGGFERYSYRGDDLLLEATNCEAELRFERDVMGRVLAEHTRFADGSEALVRSAYRSDGKRIRVETEGLTQTIERDPVGHVTRVAVAEQPWEVSFERDAMGLELSRRFANGARGHWRRDTLGRPEQRVLAGTDFEHHQHYAWSREQQLDSVDDSATGLTHYRYDDHGRPHSSEIGGVTTSLRELDEAGNVYARRDRSDRRYLSGGRPLELPDVRFEYDLDGRVSKRLAGSGDPTRYRWDDAGMLAAIELPDGRELRFRYDALGRRLAKQLVALDGDSPQSVAETRWIWDGNNPMTELDANNGRSHWLFEPDSFRPLAQLGSTGTLSAFVDPIGAPTEWVDDHGRLRARSRIDLHGRQRFSEDGLQLPWAWPGQYHDAESGLSYNRFRYYDPASGGYLGADPIGLLGGLDPRAYVPNPLTATDPLGLAYKTWQIHSPGYPDVVQKGLHFFAPGGLELSVRPNHAGGISFTNAIPGDSSHRGLTAAINAAHNQFETNAVFRADILNKAREGISSVIEHAKDQSSDSLRNLANGRSREMRDIVRNVERREGGGGCH